MEADFQRFYNLDLGEAAFGTRHVGVRRLRTLIANLPADSAYGQALRGAKPLWTHTDDMTALLVNVVMLHRWEWLTSHGVQMDQPELVVSPWAPEPELPALNTGAELAAFLGTPVNYAGGT